MPGGKPVTSEPGLTPISPVMVVPALTTLVSVEPARTVKSPANPKLISPSFEEDTGVLVAVGAGIGVNVEAGMPVLAGGTGIGVLVETGMLVLVEGADIGVLVKMGSTVGVFVDTLVGVKVVSLVPIT